MSADFKFNEYLSLGLKKYWIFFGLVFLLGGMAGTLITKHYLLIKEANDLKQIYPIRSKNTNSHYTNPLLGYNFPNNKEFDEFQPLEKKLNNFINSQKQSGQINKISVYFRDLNMGRWTGINENDKYDPASMLKVVIMIAYYKESENDPAFLNKQIIYTQSLDKDIEQVAYQTPSELKTDQKYSIQQLIEAMIVNSDNGAKNALLANINPRSLNEVYTDLGLQPPNDTQNYTISAKAYSLFFRILYNTTYLDENNSEKALSLLTKAGYKDGLVAGLPANVEAAHKFGEHVNTDANGQITDVELHDCGIIYYPQKPYLLCVMTSGPDIGKLASAIKNISQLVYSDIDSNYNN